MIGRILAGVLIAALCTGVAGAAPGDSTRSVPDNSPSIGNGVSEPAQTTPKASPKKPKKSKSRGKSMTAAGTMPVKPAIAPAHIEVQHILIGFSGSVPGKNITRTKEEAMKLAHEILDKARKGANFDSLVAKYTDDSPPGIYKMAAEGVPPLMSEYGRKQMVPAFGNVGFAISPGNIDIAEYDPTTSPFGWHIIKRLR
jgi:hypothetical protein